jgi:hypothetical protein
MPLAGIKQERPAAVLVKFRRDYRASSSALFCQRASSFLGSLDDAIDVFNSI